MERRRAALGLVVAALLLAVASVVAFPHAGDRRYTYEAERVTATEDVLTYENLSTSAQRVFRNALDGSHTEYGEEGEVSRLSPTANVRYQNATYRVRSTPTGGQGAAWALGRVFPLALSALLGGAGLALHTTRE